MKKLYLFCFAIFFGCDTNQAIVADKILVTSEVEIISTCPKGMEWIQGKYCPKVIQICKTYMESPESTPFARCLEFNKTKCDSDTIQMNFCIDKEEYAPIGSSIPLSDISWTNAKLLCEKENKRLCKESEWEFACEGEEMLPYTTGYTRPTNLCNIDLSKNIVCGKYLCDYRKSIVEDINCISPFGVHNMSGNVDEWIEVPKYLHSKTPNLWMRSALKGGHWLPVRNRCRPKTVDHDESFHQISVGFRCCQDVK
jgi:formylglycine-generating enzyme required for sulfatase activity